MIKLYCTGDPDDRIKEFAPEIFSLKEKKQAYNLPTDNFQYPKLFQKLFNLGVVQIIHDGKADLLRCVNGYTNSLDIIFGKKTKNTKEIIIKNSKK